MTTAAYPIESQVYLPGEIAAAAGVPERDVVAALGGRRGYIGHDEAVTAGRSLRRAAALGASASVLTAAPAPFGMFGETSHVTPSRVPFAVSGTVHAGLISAVILFTSFAIAPTATVTRDSRTDAGPQLVFLNLPGPGGGGGGGGREQQAAPPRARRLGQSPVSSPVPERETPPPARR